MKRARNVLCLSFERKLRYRTIYSLCFVAEKRFCEFVRINILKHVKQDENALNKKCLLNLWLLGRKYELLFELIHSNY